MSQNRPISAFIEKNYLHFNAAALVDAAKAYKKHIADGKKMMVTLAGAMSTGELAISFAETPGYIQAHKLGIASPESLLGKERRCAVDYVHAGAQGIPDIH